MAVSVFSFCCGCRPGPCVAKKSLNSKHSFRGSVVLPKPTVFSLATLYLGILTDNGGEGGGDTRYKQIIKDSRPVHRDQYEMVRNFNVYKKRG